MTTKELLKNIAHDPVAKTLFYDHLWLTYYNHEGKLFTWKHTTIKGTWHDESYCSTNWEEDNIPIYTADEMKDFEVMEYKIDFDNNALSLKLDI